MDYAAALDAVKQPQGLQAEDLTAVCDMLFTGDLSVDDGAQLLVAWNERGETATELAHMVRYLRERAVRVPVSQPCLDLCGTGGTGLTRFNISTTAAFVLAAAGVPVAKHGNFGSARPNGSFNLLQELGVPFELSPAALAQLQTENGVCFLFARIHHPVVGKVVPYRKAAARRTIFNLAGPLANPGEVRCQLIGVADWQLADVVGGALQQLGLEAMVVHGEPGIDELSVVGESRYRRIGETAAEGVLAEIIHPNLQHGDLPGGDAPENAKIFQDLLHGRETGPLLDMVCVNAGAAIDLWHGNAPAVQGAGFTRAKELLASGAVADTFERHKSLAVELA